MNSREVVSRTIRFQGADRLPYGLPEAYGTDFAGVGMTPSPDRRPPEGVDEWGAVWENIGVCSLGQVKDFPLKEWRAIWKPRYARIYRAAHDAGLLTFLHSCGYIVDILDDLIEVGLDVIHMDQQENMGLALLGERFGGRLTFYAPVDIQHTMAHGTLDEIRAYCRDMVRLLGRPEGGFIPRWYSDPVGAGHRQEAIDSMSQEFLRLSHLHGRGALSR